MQNKYSEEEKSMLSETQGFLIYLSMASLVSTSKHGGSDCSGLISSDSWKHSQRSERLTTGFQPLERSDRGISDIGVAMFSQLDIALWQPMAGLQVCMFHLPLLS